MQSQPNGACEKYSNNGKRQRDLISRIVVSRTKVRSGESISVIVRTNPGRKGEKPLVRICGAAGSQQFVQLSGPPGPRTLLVIATAQEHIVDSRTIEVEVLPADLCSPAPILDVRGDPTREATGLWSIRNASEIHRTGAYYVWNYGAKYPMITHKPEATISYAELLGPNELFKVCHMELVVRYADESLRQAKRSVTVWNRYALAKQRGIVQPSVTYDFKASPEGNDLVGRARINNRDEEEISFTGQQVQWLMNASGATAEPGPPSKVSIVVPPHSFADFEHRVRLDSLPPDAFGFGVILLGHTSTGLTAHAAAYFEHHLPRANSVNAIMDPILVALIQDLRSESCDGSRRRFTRTELEDFARKREARREGPVSDKVGLLFRESPDGIGQSLESQQCLPDQTPPEEGLACQLTDEWGWVQIPGRFVNARMGDVLLSPGSGGPVFGVLRNVSPPQIFSHSAIMIENYYKVRHSTASEEWLESKGGIDGFEPEALKFIWPGTIDQTAENAMNGEPFDDPDGLGGDRGYVKKYILSAMAHGGLGLSNEIIDPLVVKPHPLIEAERPWVRANLHRVAAAARQIKGHYRFFAFTDAQISAEPAGSFLAPRRDGWWASETRPTVCSALVWAAAASLRNPEVRLEGRGPFTQRSELETRDKSPEIGADVDFLTRDGLYFYSEEERLKAGNWLYDYFYNKALNVAWNVAGPLGSITGAASRVANQICNAFASDFTDRISLVSVGGPTLSFDWLRWRNPGLGRAVSPDNIMNWDQPTEFDGETVHGLYGFTEPLIYRQPYIEFRRISRWKRVPTRGNLLGEVKYKNSPVDGAIVNAGGHSFLSDGAGQFSVELPSGEYHVHAGKHINGGFAEGDATATVVVGQDVHVVVELQDPPALYRRLNMQGTMNIEDYEEFGANEGDTRYLARYSEVGPYDTHDEVLWTETLGGEIRVELTLRIDWKIDLSIDIDWHVKLYEGTSELTNDLDGERWGRVNVLKDEVQGFSIYVWNEDENERYDRAAITLTVTNSVRP